MRYIAGVILKNMKKCVFSGTFDPPTKGHEKIIKTCLEIFDEVVVAVMVNPDKTPLLMENERETLLKKLFADEKRVKVCVFYGAAVDLLERENTNFYVRGVRDCIDFEFENRNYYASKKLKNNLIEIYIPAEQENLHISSTAVRTSVRFKKEYLQYIPASIQKDLLEMLKNKN